MVATELSICQVWPQSDFSQEPFCRYEPMDMEVGKMTIDPAPQPDTASLAALGVPIVS